MELRPEGLRRLIERAAGLKPSRHGGPEVLRRQCVAILLERPSTRTRVSFEVAVSQLGGTALVLRSDESQLSRGESARDTALVLSRYVEAIVARVADHARIEELAKWSAAPV